MGPMSDSGAWPTSPAAENLDSLKAQAKSMEDQLRAMNERIAGVEKGAPVPAFVAAVDAERCNACGVCEDVCPFDAVTVDDVAQVNRQRCTGCGRCVSECPQDALCLRKA